MVTPGYISTFAYLLCIVPVLVYVLPKQALLTYFEASGHCLKEEIQSQEKPNVASKGTHCPIPIKCQLKTISIICSRDFFSY